MTKVVNIEPDKSPDTLMFLLDQSVEGPSICIAKGSKAADAHPLGSAIFTVSGASSIFFSGRTIRVTKEPRVEWSDLIDPICAAIESAGSTGSKAPGQQAVEKQMPEENPFLPAPLNASRYAGRSIDRKLAKRKGFTKRSIKKVETWLGTFRTVTDSCHSNKIVIGVYVQVGGDAAIKNVYADVQLLTISLMGEGRMESLGNDLFGDDRNIAYEMIDSILTPEGRSSRSPEPVATLPTERLEAIVASVLAVNGFSLEKAVALIPALRARGMTDPFIVSRADISDVIAGLYEAGYRRGMLAEMMADRLMHLMKAIVEGHLDALPALLARKQKPAAMKLLGQIKGIGPKVAESAWMLVNRSHQPS